MTLLPEDSQELDVGGILVHKTTIPTNLTDYNLEIDTTSDSELDLDADLVEDEPSPLDYTKIMLFQKRRPTLAHVLSEPLPAPVREIQDRWDTEYHVLMAHVQSEPTGFEPNDSGPFRTKSESTIAQKQSPSESYV